MDGEKVHRPIVRDIISDQWDATWAFLLEPNEKTFWNIFAVQSSYYLMPLVGGYLRSEAYVQYKKDTPTYKNSELSMDYIFAEAMELFKYGYWGFFALLDSESHELVVN